MPSVRTFISLPAMSLKPYLAIAAICIIWGTTYLAIRIGVKDFPPFLFSGLRFTLAGGLICAYFLMKGTAWPSAIDFRNLMISGLCICLGGNLLLVVAEKNIPSGLAALINCGFPFWIVIISKLIHKAEKISTITIAGLVIGFFGQLLIFYDQLKFIISPAYISGIIASLFGVLFAAFGSVYMKKHAVKSNPVFSGGVARRPAGCNSSSPDAKPCEAGARLRRPSSRTSEHAGMNVRTETRRSRRRSGPRL